LQRMNTINALTHCIRDHDLLDHWEDIRGIADGLRARRNDLVHAEWDVVGGETSRRRIKGRRRVTVSLEWISPEQLEALDAEIGDLIDDLAWFQYQLARRGLSKALSAANSPPLDRTQSRKARAQAQARATKQAHRQAERDRSKPQTD
jgi:hypothetical protein